MAIVSTLSNHAKKQIMDAEIDFGSHEFRCILMDTAFAFDKDTHATYGDVSANELAAGNGYSLSGEVLSSGELTEDDSNDRGRMTWGNITWTASGGSIGATGAAVVVGFGSSDDTVVGCIDYGSDYTVADGSSFQLQSLAVNLT